jgi:phage baseplate assembly protein V
MNRQFGQYERTLANAAQLGRVAETDYPKARARVILTDGLRSAWLPWLACRAGGDRTWWAPEVDEQVLVVCPDGDPARGVIVGALYCQDASAPADAETVHRTEYKDGASIEYDRAAHALKATLPDGGTAELTAKGGITLIGPTEVRGTLKVTEATTLQDTLDVSKASTLKDTLDVAKAATLKDTLDVTKAATLQQTLDVTGNTTIQGMATVTQVLNANGGLAATGAVGGAAMSLVGDMAIQGSAAITGAMAAGGNIAAGGNLTAGGTVTSTGDQVAGGISQTNHVHTGIEPGSGESEKPK